MAPLRIRLARRSKDCRASVDKPPPPVARPKPSDDQEDHRWSDVVPPRTALTFFAIYDPDEGLLAFSGGSLLPLDLPDLPSAAADDKSQVFTLDGTERAAAPTPTPSTGQLTSETAMRDMQTLFQAYFRGDAEEDEEQCEGCARMPEARVSSTLEGLYCNTDVRPCTPMGGDDDDDDDETLRRSPGKLSRNDSGYASDEGEECGRVRATDTDEFDSFFALYDDRSVDDPNEISAFSVTTTSTSSYIDVDLPSLSSSPSTASSSPPSTFWSALEAPELASLNVLAYSSAPPPRKRSTSFSNAKRLFKARSFSHHAHAPDAPAKPSKVLARADYNYSYTPSASPSPPPSARVRRALSKRWLRLKGSASGCGDAGWVCVEVEHRVTQRDLREDLSL